MDDCLVFKFVVVFDFSEDGLFRVDRGQMDLGGVGHQHVTKVISGSNALVGPNAHDRIKGDSPLQIMP